MVDRDEMQCAFEKKRQIGDGSTGNYEMRIRIVLMDDGARAKAAAALSEHFKAAWKPKSIGGGSRASN
jgi:hypothetical protein